MILYVRDMARNRIKRKWLDKTLIENKKPNKMKPCQ